MTRASRYSPEVRERAVRMVLEHEREYDSQWSAIVFVHHSDRGVQYLSIRYTERLAEAGIEPSVGSASATRTTKHLRKRSSACTRRR